MINIDWDHVHHVILAVGSQLFPGGLTGMTKRPTYHSRGEDKVDDFKRRASDNISVVSKFAIAIGVQIFTATLAVAGGSYVTLKLIENDLLNMQVRMIERSATVDKELLHLRQQVNTLQSLHMQPERDLRPR